MLKKATVFAVAALGLSTLGPGGAQIKTEVPKPNSVAPVIKDTPPKSNSVAPAIKDTPAKPLPANPQPATDPNESTKGSATGPGTPGDPKKKPNVVDPGVIATPDKKPSYRFHTLAWGEPKVGVTVIRVERHTGEVSHATRSRAELSKWETFAEAAKPGPGEYDVIVFRSADDEFTVTRIDHVSGRAWYYSGEKKTWVVWP